MCSTRLIILRFATKFDFVIGGLPSYIFNKSIFQVIFDTYYDMVKRYTKFTSPGWLWDPSSLQFCLFNWELYFNLCFPEFHPITFLWFDSSKILHKFNRTAISCEITFPQKKLPRNSTVASCAARALATLSKLPDSKAPWKSFTGHSIRSRQSKMQSKWRKVSCFETSCNHSAFPY